LTSHETDALLALRNAVIRTALALQTRMQKDGQAPEDWDYFDTLNEAP
jgi:hypothetical protein